MRKYLLVLAMATIPFSAAQARLNCDLDNDADSSSVVASIDFDFEDGDLIVEDGFDEILRITPKGDLFIHAEEIDVSDHQRELLVTYYDQVEGIKDDAIDLGIEAAKFGVRTAVSAIFMALTMDDDEADEFEEKIQRDAEQFEHFAERICDRVDALVQLEEELAHEIPEFTPMIRRHRGLSI